MFRLALVYTRSNNAQYNHIYGFMHFLADFCPCDSGPPSEELREGAMVSVGIVVPVAEHCVKPCLGDGVAEILAWVSQNNGFDWCGGGVLRGSEG